MTRKRYPEIADDLRIRITSGELTPGAQLPAQPELQAEYKASLMTIRRALDELVREGLLETKDKVGVFVRDQRRYRLEVNTHGGPVGFSPSFPSLASRLLQEVSAPDRPLSQTVEIRRPRPASHVADRLRLRDGGGTLLRHTVFYAGPDRISFADGYFPTELVAGSDLERAEPIHSIFAVLDGLRMDPYEVVNEVLIRHASALERAEMRWPANMYVLVQICTTYTAAGQPVYCWESVLPGDRWILAERQYRDDVQSVRAIG